VTLAKAARTSGNINRPSQGVDSPEDIERRYPFSEGGPGTLPSGFDPTPIPRGAIMFTGQPPIGGLSSQRDYLLGGRLLYRISFTFDLQPRTANRLWQTTHFGIANEVMGQFHHPDTSTVLPNEETTWPHFSLSSVYVVSEDPLGIRERLQGFKDLKDGWADGMQHASEWGQGYGNALDPDGVDWLAKVMALHYKTSLPKPYIYPIPEGGILLEWSLGDNEASLEIDLEEHSAEWHCLDVRSNRSYERQISLDEPTSWQWLAAEISRLESRSA